MLTNKTIVVIDADIVTPTFQLVKRDRLLREGCDELLSPMEASSGSCLDPFESWRGMRDCSSSSLTSEYPVKIEV